MPNHHIPFQLGSLPQLEDGRVEVAFNAAIQQVLDDLYDRPNVKKARKVTMEFTLEPQADDAGMLENVEAKVAFKTTTPARETRTFSMPVRRKRGKTVCSFSAGEVEEEAEAEE